MDCGYLCLLYLFKLNGYHSDGLLDDYLKYKTDKGLSIYDLCQLAQMHGYPLQAYRSFKMMHRIPYIMYLRGFKTGHYIVVERVNRFIVDAYDPYLGKCRCFKWLLYLKFSFIVLIML